MVNFFKFNASGLVPINSGLDIYDATFRVIKPRVFFDVAEGQGRSYGSGANSAGGNFYATLIDSVTQSPTALQCIKTQQDYLYGGGLAEYGGLELRDSEAGIKTTVNKIFRKMCDVFPFTWGAALRVLDNGMIEVIDFSSVRYQLPDSLGLRFNSKARAYLPKKEEKYRIEYASTFSWFGRAAASLFISDQIMNLRIGDDLFLEFKSNPYDLFYPVPGYYSGIEAIMAEPSAMRWLKNGLKNGFSANSILSISGDPDQEVIVGETYNGETNVPVYKKVREIIDERMSEEFTGDGGSRVMVIYDRLVDLKQVDTSLKGSDVISQIIGTLQSNIAAAFDVDPRLANIQTSGKLGGSGEELDSIRAIQRERVKTLRDIILDCLYSAISSRYAGIDREAMVTNMDVKHGEEKKRFGLEIPIQKETRSEIRQAAEIAAKDYAND